MSPKKTHWYNEVSRDQWKSLNAATIGYFLDGFDFNMVNLLYQGVFLCQCRIIPHSVGIIFNLNFRRVSVTVVRWTDVWCDWGPVWSEGFNGYLDSAVRGGNLYLCLRAIILGSVRCSAIHWARDGW